MRREFLISGCTSVLVAALLLSSCITAHLERRLDPQSEEFFSKVRYIISREESRIFLELPPSQRSKFIEEFWLRRDPTPGTERNEYRDAYLERIKEANHLFKGGRSGWLQDRGHIYIMFGPPDERVTNPMGGRVIDPYASPDTMVEGRSSQRIAAGEKPTEVWVYYDLFSSLQRPHTVRLVFVDTEGTGDYKLTTNLQEILPGTMGADTEFPPNLILTHELYKEEAERVERHLKKALFNFSWEFIREKNAALGSNLLIRLTLPYKKIIFREAGKRLKADLEFRIQIKSPPDEVIWQFGDVYTLDFSEEYLSQNRESAWEVEVPVTMRLNKGGYSVFLHLRNMSGDQEVEKLLPLKI